MQKKKVFRGEGLLTYRYASNNQNIIIIIIIIIIMMMMMVYYITHGGIKTMNYNVLT